MNKISLIATLFLCLLVQMLTAQASIDVTYTCEFENSPDVVTTRTFEVQLFDFVNKRYRYIDPISGNSIIHTGNTSTPSRWEVRLIGGSTPAFFNDSFDEATPPCLFEGGWQPVPNSGTCQVLNALNGGCSQPPLPANATFSDAINLPFQELCENPTVGSVFGAVPITEPNCSAISCSEDYGVWYEFTVPGDNALSVNTTVSVVSEMLVEYAVELRTSPSGSSQNVVSCTADINGKGEVNLSAALSTTSAAGSGKKYWVRVYPRNCTAPLEEEADFFICVSGLPSVSIPDAGGVCLNADAGFNSVGDNKWKYITKDGDLLFGLLDSEALGMVAGSFYSENSATPRMNSDMQPVFNRNFTVTPANQPTNPVRIRLFVSQEEYDNFIQNTDATSLNDLLIYRHSNIDVCLIQPPSGGVLETILASGPVSTTGYYLELEIASFSAFFISENSSVLPVSWQSFTAKRTKKTEASLLWSTSFEQSNAYFEIERSENNLEFETVGRIEAKGYSEVTTTYQFTDKLISENDLLYRLRQVDTDGTASYSKIVAVNGENTLSKVQLFPNPARQEVQVTGVNDDTFSMRLVNLYGQTVRNYRLDADLVSIPVYDIPLGVYLLEGRSKNGTLRWIERLIISN